MINRSLFFDIVFELLQCLRQIPAPKAHTEGIVSRAAAGCREEKNAALLTRSAQNSSTDPFCSKGKAMEPALGRCQANSIGVPMKEPVQEIEVVPDNLQVAPGNDFGMPQGDGCHKLTGRAAADGGVVLESSHLFEKHRVAGCNPADPQAGQAIMF